MGAFTKDTRTISMHTTCHVCGKDAYPQMMQAVFYQGDGACKSWFLVGWEHLKCEPPGPCSECEYGATSRICHNEASVWHQHHPRSKGCQHWERRKDDRSYVDDFGRPSLWCSHTTGTEYKSIVACRKHTNH